jgi:hypothetical protein
MTERLLPETGVQALGRWWRENEVTYADGTPGAHAVRYTPARWAEIVPWPSGLAPVSDDGDTWVSRAQVARIVADALKREEFREALVATYVWGKGKRGTPAGSGPTTLHAHWPRRTPDRPTPPPTCWNALSSTQPGRSRVDGEERPATQHTSRVCQTNGVTEKAATRQKIADSPAALPGARVRRGGHP